MKLIRTFLILVALVLLFHITASADSFNEIKVDKDNIKIVVGQTVEVVVHDPNPGSLKYIVDKEKTGLNLKWGEFDEEDNVPLYITAFSTVNDDDNITHITVSVVEHPEISKEITVEIIKPIELTNVQKKQIQSVYYISDRSFFNYQSEGYYALRFILKDKKDKILQIPAYVDIRIENNSGDTVYQGLKVITTDDYVEWTSALKGDRTLATVKIYPEEILPGSDSNGNVYFTVYYPGYYKFDEFKLSTFELPKLTAEDVFSLALPDFPVEVKYYNISGEVQQSLQINEITYEFKEIAGGKYNLFLYYTGEKTLETSELSASSSVPIGYKLYDAEGYVVASGKHYSDSIAVGEKFRNKMNAITSLSPGEYKLVLVDSNLAGLL